MPATKTWNGWKTFNGWKCSSYSIQRKSKSFILAPIGLWIWSSSRIQFREFVIRTILTNLLVQACGNVCPPNLCAILLVFLFLICTKCYISFSCPHFRGRAIVADKPPDSQKRFFQDSSKPDYFSVEEAMFSYISVGYMTPPTHIAPVRHSDFVNCASRRCSSS